MKAAIDSLRRAAPLVLILLLAGGLRTLPLGVSSYAWDEARISYDALRLVRGGEFLFFGQPSSVGVPFFPASVWAFVPPYALSPDPLTAVLYVAALNTLMIGGVWWLARRWNTTAAAIAALFLAATPYAVLYSRSIWQPNLLAPLTLAWLIAAFHGATGTGRARAIGSAAAVALAGLGVQIHFAGAVLLPLTLYASVRWRWYRSPRPLLIGALVPLVAALPYLYALLTTPGLLTRAEAAAGRGLTVDLGAAGHLLRLMVGWDWAYLGGGEIDRVSRGAVTPLIAAGLALAGLIGLLRTLRQPPSPGRTLAELAFGLLIGPPLFFLVHTSAPLPHYLLTALPAAALLIGLSARALRRAGWIALLTALILTALWTAQLILTLTQVSVERPPNSALSSILSESRRAAHGAAASGDPVLFYTHGDDPLIDGEVTVFTTLLWDRPHRIFDGNRVLILPPYPAVLLATLAPLPAWEELEAGGLAASPVEYPRRAGALPFVAVGYNGRAELAGFTRFDRPIAFASGVQLEGWRARWVGLRWRVSTLWRVTAGPPAGPIQQFTHLYRPDDDRDAAPFLGSDVGLSLHLWRPGDRVVVMADFFNVPPGAGYTLAIGQYRLDDGARIALEAGGERVLIDDVAIAPPDGP